MFFGIVGLWRFRDPPRARYLTWLGEPNTTGEGAPLPLWLVTFHHCSPLVDEALVVTSSHCVSIVIVEGEVPDTSTEIMARPPADTARRKMAGIVFPGSLQRGVNQSLRRALIGSSRPPVVPTAALPLPPAKALSAMCAAAYLTAAAVAIDSVPPQGVLTLKWSFYRFDLPGAKSVPAPVQSVHDVVQAVSVTRSRTISRWPSSVLRTRRPWCRVVGSRAVGSRERRRWTSSVAAHHCCSLP